MRSVYQGRSSPRTTTGTGTHVSPSGRTTVLPSDSTRCAGAIQFRRFNVRRASSVTLVDGKVKQPIRCKKRASIYSVLRARPIHLLSAPLLTSVIPVSDSYIDDPLQDHSHFEIKPVGQGVAGGNDWTPGWGDCTFDLTPELHVTIRYHGPINKKVPSSSKEVVFASAVAPNTAQDTRGL